MANHDENNPSGDGYGWSDAVDWICGIMRGMRKLRENLPNFTLKHLSPLAAGGYIVPVGKGGPASSRCAYKLTRKGGEEVAQW